MTDLLTALTALTALACAVAAGVFLAFSSFVMRALDTLPPAPAVAAMQAINASAIPSSFFFIAYATVLPCLGLAVWAAVDWHESAAPYVLAGSALYVIGSMGVTAATHLPRNDALATVDPESAEAAERWSRYFAEWMLWNHVRAAGAFAAAMALTAALLVG